MKKLITLSLILLASTQMNAQWWGGGEKGNGDVITINREVGEYDEVSVGGSFDVELVAGPEGKITLTGESNLLELIETEVKGGNLSIRVQRGKNIRPSNRKGIQITVPFKDLSGVSLAGSGDVVGKAEIRARNFSCSVAGSGDLVLDVDAADTKASVTGSGDLTLRGKTRDFDAKVTGSGDIHAADFKADNVNANVTGSGDVSVYAAETIKARVTGSGDIEYKGNPSKKETKVTGSGGISKM